MPTQQLTDRLTKLAAGVKTRCQQTTPLANLTLTPGVNPTGPSVQVTPGTTPPLSPPPRPA